MIDHTDHTIIKHFNDPVSFHRELRVYQQGLPVTPTLIDCQIPKSLVLQRIEGVPYLDVLNEDNTHELAGRIAIFHRSSFDGSHCLCHFDNQPENILWDGATFYLIDFSSVRTATPESDLTHLFLFWAEEFEPAHFRRLTEIFIPAYGFRLPLDPERWKRALAHSILRFDLRRRLYSKKHPHQHPSLIQANRKHLYLIGLR